jgi:hypothetical protein
LTNGPLDVVSEPDRLARDESGEKRLASLLAAELYKWKADDLSDDGDLTEFIVYGPFNLLEVAVAVHRAMAESSRPSPETSSGSD